METYTLCKCASKDEALAVRMLLPAWGGEEFTILTILEFVQVWA